MGDSPKETVTEAFIVGHGTNNHKHGVSHYFMLEINSGTFGVGIGQLLWMDKNKNLLTMIPYGGTILVGEITAISNKMLGFTNVMEIKTILNHVSATKPLDQVATDFLPWPDIEAKSDTPYTVNAGGDAFPDEEILSNTFLSPITPFFVAKKTRPQATFPFEISTEDCKAYYASFERNWHSTLEENEPVIHMAGKRGYVKRNDETVFYPCSFSEDMSGLAAGGVLAQQNLKPPFEAIQILRNAASNRFALTDKGLDYVTGAELLLLTRTVLLDSTTEPNVSPAQYRTRWVDEKYLVGVLDEEPFINEQWVSPAEYMAKKDFFERSTYNATEMFNPVDVSMDLIWNDGETTQVARTSSLALSFYLGEQKNMEESFSVVMEEIDWGKGMS